jgi:uncharacterized CHY-type Zn-finger protein
MIKKIDVYYSAIENQYFFPELVNCDKCKRELTSVSFLLWDFWKTHFSQKIYCMTCRNDILNAGGKYQEFKQVVICFVDFLPEDVIVVFPERPNLVNNNNNVFDVAITNMDDERVIDHAVQSRDKKFMVLDYRPINHAKLISDLSKKDDSLINLDIALKQIGENIE